MSTLVFLPAWNEAENLPAVLDELQLVLPEADLLVVDDGSTDATADGRARRRRRGRLVRPRTAASRPGSPRATPTRSSTATTSAAGSTPTGNIP